MHSKIGDEIEDGENVMDIEAKGPRDSVGALLTMCVLHEIAPPGPTPSAQAMSVIGGISVCRDHLVRVVGNLVDGYTIAAILKDAKNGQY